VKTKRVSTMEGSPINKTPPVTSAHTNKDNEIAVCGEALLKLEDRLEVIE
jgi:hypothetical protein